MKKSIDLLSQLHFYPCENLFKGCNPQNVYYFGDCPADEPSVNALAYINGDCGSTVDQKIYK